MKVNETLKLLRQSRNMTQNEAAEILNVSLSSYQKYEREKNSVIPSLDVLIRIADYYGVSVDYLLGRETGEPTAMEKLADQFNMTALEREILNGYVNLPKEMRGDLMEFLHKAVKNVMTKNEPQKNKPDLSDYTRNIAAGTGEEGLTDSKINEVNDFAKQIYDLENDIK